MKNKMTNGLKLSFATASVLIIGVCVSGIAHGVSEVKPQGSASYIQIERLGRPAINEGLVLSNANLNAFNSIPPSLDLRTDIPAVDAVLTEATAVLTVVHNLGMNAGLTPPTVATVTAQFLPDVLRISVNDADYGTLHALNANGDRTSNSKQNEVAYTACVSVTSGAPLLCGGRKIRDDVIDITLSYLAGGAGQAAPAAGTPTNVPAYIVSDNISYTTAHSGALLSSFPFLALPQ